MRKLAKIYKACDKRRGKNYEYLQENDSLADFIEFDVAAPEPQVAIAVETPWPRYKFQGRNRR